MQQPHEALGEELLGLERKYWQAMTEKDAVTATALSDDPCVVVGAQGVGEIDHATLAGMVSEAPWELSDYDLEDVLVREVAAGVVVVAYKIKEDLVVEGEDVALEAYDASVWVRRDDKWCCALHTESVAGDPFGRN